MFETLRNAWRIEDLRKKIIYTILMLLVYRIGVYIPVPGIDPAALKNIMEGNSNNLLGLMDVMSGGAFGQFTVFAMGIFPYINATIIMQLLTIAIPALERLSKEGEEGRKKITQITRYVTIGLAFLQAFGITFGLARSAVANDAWYNYLLIALTLTAGTAFIMWLAEQITEKGIGNGTSLIIFISIISRLPQAINAIFQMAFGPAKSISPLLIPFIVIFAVALIMGVIFIDLGQRRIPVQYAKRVVGRKMYGGQSTHIPIKVNASGVLPIIFAVSFMALPSTIATFIPNSGFAQFVGKYFSQQTPAYAIIYALLIVGFTFFYSQISFNPIEISKNLKQNGGFVQGIRPGKPTSDFLAKIVTRITLVGALFLAAIAIIPIIVGSITGIPMYIQGTSVLILVNVSLETSKQIESQMLMRHYKGFLK